MSLLRDAAFAAAGYGLNSLMHSGDKKNTGYQYDNLEDLILEYAHRHDIWGRDQNFYNRLIKIAEQFRDPYA